MLFFSFDMIVNEQFMLYLSRAYLISLFLKLISRIPEYGISVNIVFDISQSNVHIYDIRIALDRMYPIIIH